MNRFFAAFLAIGLLLGAGCTNPITGDTLVETTPRPTSPAKSTTFTPPTGADLASGVETPGRRRLMSATSTDGITFTRTDEVVADQANVPDLVMDADGTIYLYYSGWTVGNRTNAAAVAISEDQGKTWTHHQVAISAKADMTHSGDPDIVILADGTFRLYSTFNLPGSQDAGIFVADGTDGIHFVSKGVAFQAEPSAVDSNTALLGDTWHMWTLTHQSMQTYHATSDDGVTFEEKEHVAYRAGREEVAMSNVLPTADGYRMYAFSPGAGDIRSLVSTDGETWTAEAGARLTLDETSGLEAEYVKDPAVIRLKDGTYLMVYVTQIP